ncbi:MAG: polyphosphate kinase 2, partial [Polaromonas sp.]|nr:polyphosphate kinase 2 [Polaromonas sp.]
MPKSSAKSAAPARSATRKTSSRRKAATPAVQDEVRASIQGDRVPSIEARALETFVATQATQAQQSQQLQAALSLLGEGVSAPVGGPATRAQALRALLEGAAPDDRRALVAALTDHEVEAYKTSAHESPDEELSSDWREGGYPYKNLLRRSVYEKEKFRLQVELLKLQAWVKESGQRVVILFEGRDAAGKGGAIKRFMEHLNPRGARVVALEKPSDNERGQWYFQRYVQHLPTRGEIVLFDRSWYNRAGVERVMGFCSDAEYFEFMRQAPEFERQLVRSGVHVI